MLNNSNMAEVEVRRTHISIELGKMTRRTPQKKTIITGIMINRT